MKDKDRLMKLRKAAKKRQPTFVVKESHNKRKITARWRYAGGRHSGVRQEHRGKQRLVRIGYGSPREVRGLHHTGLKQVLVKNIQDLLALHPQEEGAIISSTIGNKKRSAVLELAIQKKITILNIKNLPQTVADLKGTFSARQKLKQEKVHQKDKKQQDKEKKAAEKKKKEAEEKAMKASGKDQTLEGSIDSADSAAQKAEQKDQEKKEIEKELNKRQ